MKKQWFETWFDSKYYHLLYKKRDKHEASLFISNIISFLQPDKNSIFLDLACGRGRHSIYLNGLGYTVDGLDYSKNNIQKAKQYENESLRFYEHDMRKPIPHLHYNYVLNLFTSFGYFKNDLEHQNSIDNVYECLNNGGLFVLDYLNIEWVKQNLKSHEKIHQSGIDFLVTKKIEDGFVRKNISFSLEGEEYNFEENVRAFSAEELTQLMFNSGFRLLNKLGNYNMDTFKENSERLILIVQK